jgi:hypothetical protein
VNPSASRRRFNVRLAWGLAGLAGVAWPARAADNALPVPASLAAAAQAAVAREPLVLLVSLPGCPYCELVRRSYLLPLRAQGLHAWQIDLTDARTAIADFSGAASTGAQLARRWQARVAPTLLFFDAAGRELAQRLVGIAVPDFFGAYLDERLATARKALS